MIRPERLKKGDTVGVIAPSGPPNIKDVESAAHFFRDLGLHVRMGKHVDKVHGYLAGSDQQRLEDLHAMIQDPTIKAIIFARGGYGAGRIIADIDYSLIQANPKIIWGYSDITYLHTAIRQLTGLVTFHGPMLASDIAKENFDGLTQSMFNQLFEPSQLIYSEKISSLTVYNEGDAEGILVGGNLSLVVSTLGTPYEIDTKDKLLLLEDIDEEPYRVDSMLNQLRLAGKLQEAAGIVVGDFAKAEAQMDLSLSLEEVFHDYFSKLDCPVLEGFQIGHCLPHIAVPLGAPANLSTKKKTLIVEPGVS
ncbi:S66 peptidase family protein [Oceanobacillus halotolerans]|uniref:S66 peptidase family protein n=1 Tax=Oceanobacillus halotolerans TaxID=2663380 RepID=UPI001969CB8B|nr:LD-carboxypeptidase [Oceanobacillus halotolerans]